jgi:hypothetical protein
VLTLDLARGQRMIGLTAGVAQAVLLEPPTERRRPVGWSVGAEPPWPLLDSGGVEAGGVQAQRCSNRGGGQGGPELPGQEVTRKVVEYGRPGEPAPADDPPLREIGLPQLIDRGGGLGKVVGGFEQNGSWAGHQATGLPQPINRGFGNEVLLLVDETPWLVPVAIAPVP